MTRRLPMRSLGAFARQRGPALSGFTLAELMVAAAIGSIVSLVSIGAMVEGLHLFKSNASEMVARDKGSKAIRRMTTDIQHSAKAQIFSTYAGTAGAEGQYGSCVVLQPAAGGYIVYYRYASTTDPNSGGLYVSAKATIAPNPSTDKLLASAVRGLDFRRDVSGSIRTGFDLGIFGYSSRNVGAKEADRLKFTTSSIPRN